MNALPTHVYHCDWGSAPKKRWMSRAVRHDDGHFTAFAASQVLDPAALISSILREIGGGCAMVGFDFPIGLPDFYAIANNIIEFKPWLLELDSSRWSNFFNVAALQSEISFRRPFYPHRPGGTKHSHLVSALGLATFDELRRVCERTTGKRKAACPLFWTLGANQVGRAALCGWKEVLIPALKGAPSTVSLWPFDGPLETLLTLGGVVVTETYPAEYYQSLFEAELKGKGRQSVRKAAGASLIRWARVKSVKLDSALTAAIQDGFPEGDDAFDAVVGLFGMLEVVLGERKPGDSLDNQRRKIEGWILGQEVPPSQVPS